MKKYDRHAFPHWRDINGNGLDARNQALYDAATLDLYGHRNAVVEDGRVVKAIVQCEYTGDVFNIADHNPDCDHRIPLGAAWARGACDWDQDKRTKFANSPINLIICRAGSNRQKGKRLLYDWVPPRLNLCEEYLQSLIDVGTEFGLVATKQDLLAHEFFKDKFPRWNQGIMLDSVRDWFVETFGSEFGEWEESMD